MFHDLFVQLNLCRELISPWYFFRLLSNSSYHNFHISNFLGLTIHCSPFRPKSVTVYTWIFSAMILPQLCTSRQMKSLSASTIHGLRCRPEARLLVHLGNRSTPAEIHPSEESESQRHRKDYFR